MTTEGDDELFSTTQQQVLQVTSCVTGSLSILGSSYIIYSILSAPRAAHNGGRGSNAQVKSLRNSVYLRLMFGLSCLDILFSFGSAAFSSWSTPAEVPYVHNAQGTWASCEAGAFFMHFMLGTTLYSAYLAIYFVLLVRWEFKEEVIAKRYEPSMHITAVLFPLLTAPIAIVKNYFNPLRTVPGTCWFDDYPPTCSTSDDIECIRGEGYRLLALICGALSIFFSLIVITTSMVLLVLKVRQTELKMKQYAGRSSTNDSLKLTQRTTKQALLYIGAYFITYFALVTLQFMDLPETRENRTTYFVVGFLAKLLTPLQGFLNCLVFLYRKAENTPRNSSKRTDKPQGWRVSSLFRSKTSGAPPEQASTFRMARNTHSTVSMAMTASGSAPKGDATEPTEVNPEGWAYAQDVRGVEFYGEEEEDSEDNQQEEERTAALGVAERNDSQLGFTTK